MASGEHGEAIGRPVLRRRAAAGVDCEEAGRQRRDERPAAACSADEKRRSGGGPSLVERSAAGRQAERGERPREPPGRVRPSGWRRGIDQEESPRCAGAGLAPATRARVGDDGIGAGEDRATGPRVASPASRRELGPFPGQPLVRFALVRGHEDVARRRRQQADAVPGPRSRATARRSSRRSPRAPARARTTSSGGAPQGMSTRTVARLPRMSVARSITTCGPAPDHEAQCRTAPPASRRSRRRVDLLPAPGVDGELEPANGLSSRTTARIRWRSTEAEIVGGVLSTSNEALSWMRRAPVPAGCPARRRRRRGRRSVRSAPSRCPRRARAQQALAEATASVRRRRRGTGPRRAARRRWGRQPARRASASRSGTSSD